MTKRVRNIVFASTIVIFIIAAPILLLRIYGIRIDFGEKKFVKTGGLYINVLNPNAEVYLDGKFEKTSGFLSGSVFIKNLLPRKYLVEVKKSGYFSWQKKLGVREEGVTEAKNIVLIKENPVFEVLAENIDDFLISEDNQELLVKEVKEGNWKLLILDVSTNQWQEIFSQDRLKATSTEIDLIEWDSSGRRLLLKEKSSEDQHFFVLNYEPPTGTELFDFSLEETVKKIAFHPKNKNEVLFLRGNNLFQKNFGQENEQNLFLSDVLWFEAQEENLFWLNLSGFILGSLWTSDQKEILNTLPLFLQKSKEFNIEICNRGLFLTLGEELYQLSEGGEFKKIFTQTEALKVSSDLEKLSFWGRGEIWIFKDGETEEMSFLNRFSQSPGNLFWLTPHYLIFNVGDEIKITEIDAQDYLNMVTVKIFKNPKIIFNGANGKLYVLSSNTLLSSEKLIP